MASIPMQYKFQPRYDVTCLSDGLSYRFLTEGGSEYELQFIPFDFFEGMPPGMLYVFNIDRLVRGDRPDDAERIRNSVAYAIWLFFRQVDNAILTTCEVDDGMQLGRKRLFDRWFRQMNDGSILALSARQSTGLGTTDATLYYHRDNVFRSDLEREFNRYIDLMNEMNE